MEVNFYQSWMGWTLIWHWWVVEDLRSRTYWAVMSLKDTMMQGILMPIYSFLVSFGPSHISVTVSGFTIRSLKAKLPCKHCPKLPKLWAILKHTYYKSISPRSLNSITKRTNIHRLCQKKKSWDWKVLLHLTKLRNTYFKYGTCSK